MSKVNDVDEILLYLSKAFDLVPHNRLIYEIKEGCGLSEDLTNWKKDFLGNRGEWCLRMFIRLADAVKHKQM